MKATLGETGLFQLPVSEDSDWDHLALFLGQSYRTLWQWEA